MTRIARPMAALFALVSLFLLAATVAQAAISEKRVALVIGNSAYKNTSPLKNPVNDARAISASLRRLGFEVIEGLDLDLSQMRSKVREYTTLLDGAKVALFYYAGHGFQINGNNHLAPTDATLTSESDIDFETLPLNFVLRQMEREKRTNLVFLDACRDNPLATRLSRSLKGQGRSAAMSRGLARIESGVGMLISYATSPGTVAFDGTGDHSPYTKALLKYIEKAGMSVNDMMISVRQEVLAESNGKQVPWENSSLTGRYYFRTAAKTSTAKPEAQARKDGSRASQLPGRTKREVSDAYKATVAIGSCGAYKIFEEQHRSTFYGRLAEEYIRNNCADNADRKLVAATSGKTAEPVRIPEPNSATPDTSGRKVTVEKAEKPVVVATIKEASPAIPEQAAEASASPAQKQKTDPGVLVASIQRELDRLGCRPGKIDGKWGGRTRRAVDAFNQQANLALNSTAPSETMLTALKEKNDTVCTSVAPQPAVTPRRQVSAPAPKRIAPKKIVKKKTPKKEKYWGGEDTRIDCEVKGIWTSDCFTKKH